jgi:hypothetical protein
LSRNAVIGPDRRHRHIKYHGQHCSAGDGDHRSLERQTGDHRETACHDRAGIQREPKYNRENIEPPYRPLFGGDWLDAELFDTFWLVVVVADFLLQLRLGMEHVI